MFFHEYAQQDHKTTSSVRPQKYIIIAGRESGVGTLQCIATTATIDGSRWFQPVHPHVTGLVAFTENQARSGE